MCERISKLKTFLLVSLVVALNAFGNLALAWGMRHSSPVGGDPLEYLKAMLNPFVDLGICLLSLWMLTRMALLSWADLSFVLPVTGTGYVLAAIFGHAFLHEKVSLAHWVGVLLVFVGSGMVGSTKHKTAEPNE
jgi:drug/metabolite transporter (DMT)-like permease